MAPEALRLQYVDDTTAARRDGASQGSAARFFPEGINGPRQIDLTTC